MATSCPAGQFSAPDPNNPGQVLCSGRVDYACGPPLVPVVNPQGGFGCALPPNCRVTFAYSQADPGQILVMPAMQDQPACDAAGMELAVAVLIAKLLGAR